MDIRSFFSPGFHSKSSSSGDDFSKKETQKKEKNGKADDGKRKKKASKKRTLDSDSEEEPLPQKLRKTNSSKAKVIQESDEDDDLCVIAVKKNTSKEKGKWPTDKKKKEEGLPKPNLKPTNADDFFGSTPITQRSKPTIVGSRKEPKEIKKGKKKLEEKQKAKTEEEKEIIDELCEDIDMFDDDIDFEKSLQELDTDASDPVTKKKIEPLRAPESKQSKPLEESPIPAKGKSNKPKNKTAEKTPIKQIPVEGKSSTPKKTPQSSKKVDSVSHQENDATPVLERRKSNFASYKAREGPRELGSKELPQGADNCLEGLTFVVTGILESIERDQANDLIKRYGGKVTLSISKKTSYMVVGRDPGESKLEKGKKCGTKQLNEDALFDLIRKLPGKKSKYDMSPVEKPGAHKKSPSTTATVESKYFKKEKTEEMETIAAASQSDSHSQNSLQGSSQSQPNATSAAEELLWVDKYKPKSMDKIIGQQGDKSNAKKLLKWLINWNDNNMKGTKPKGKGGFFAGKEDGSIFKCALLSGPPGVGKTTSANLVCKQAGFSFVEMNASDTRSKKTLQQVISELLSNNTVDCVFQGKKQDTGNHALVMDEVDGMAGNEDRGGIQELISLIKNTKIPIICMCNDRNHPKIRSLANYCFDLRYYKPRVEQIKGFAMSVAHREGLKIPPPVMEQIVVGANQDIRQVLHNLQMWTSTSKSMSFDEAKQEAKNSAKNIKVGSFDIVKKLFSASESEKLSIYDKTDLFFNDYSFVPLFIQENYLNCNPMQSRGNMRKTLELTSSAADAIADSSMVERLIRGGQNWSLLPLQGFFSCVLAPDMMRGGLGHKIEFPQWLGKNSSQNKHDRILQELKVHMRLSCLANKSDINLDYLWLLRKSLVSPLTESSDDVNEATKKVIDLMDAYNLTREDWESLMEIGKWGSQPDITASIPSKVKAAFTRTYNKGTHITPYANQSNAKKGKKGPANFDSETVEEEVELSDEEDEGDVTKDSMIKVKKKGNESGKSGRGKSKTQTKATGKRKSKK